MRVEVAVLGSPSLIVRKVPVDVKQHCRTELRSCGVKVEVAVLGSPSLVVLTVCVDIKQHCTRRKDEVIKPMLGVVSVLCVQGYRQENTFLVTQWPKRHTVNDLWRLLFDFKITSLVVLNEVKFSRVGGRLTIFLTRLCVWILF